MKQDHRVPAVDRAIAILDALGRYPEGLMLAGIARECGLPRSTVYRTLNSLAAAKLVRRARHSGQFVLGGRFLGLAAAVRKSLYPVDLVPIAHAHLARLSVLTGEASKLSVRDGEVARCIDAVPGTRPYSLSPLVGESFPLHAGAASKILLTAMEPTARAAVLSRPLTRHSENTVTDPGMLATELALVEQRGWAEDRGEHRLDVCALAAPVRNRRGEIVAAPSLVYLADRHEHIKRAHLADLEACCAAISAELARLE